MPPPLKQLFAIEVQGQRATLKIKQTISLLYLVTSSIFNQWFKLILHSQFVLYQGSFISAKLFPIECSNAT